MGTIRSQDAEDWLEKAIGPITSTRPIGGKRWNGSSAGLSGFEHEESFVVYSCRCRETEEMQQNPTVKMLAACIGGAEKEFLVKTSSHKLEDFYLGEALATRAIETTQTVKVPKVMTYGEERMWTISEAIMPRSYLVLEHLETDPPPYDQPAGQIFGRRMAELHSKEPRDVDAKDGNFGAQASTIYEGVHQDNEWLEDWRLFFLEQRMSYQLAIAHEYRRDPQSEERLSREWKHLQSATGQLRAFFDGVDIKPATLHGALMRANMGSVEGWPTLFNPVGYYGHHEAEFGLTWCFEPGEDFWSGYRQIIPEASGFGIRHILYELYHRLVHYNVPLEIPVDQRRKFASEALTLFNILISTFDRRRRLSLNETGRALEEAPPVDPRWDSRWAKRVLDEAAAAGRLSRDSCALAAPHAARARAPAPPQSWFDDLHDRLRLWSAQTPFELGTCAAALGVHLSSRLELALRRSQRSGAAGATRRGTLGTECEWIADPAVSESLPDFPDFPDLPAQFRLPPLVPAPRQLLPPEWLDYAPLVREPRSPQAYGGGGGGGLSDHSNPPHSDVTPPHFISDGGIRLVSGVVSGALVFGGLVLCRSQVFRASFGRLMLRRSSEHS